MAAKNTQDTRAPEMSGQDAAALKAAGDAYNAATTQAERDKAHADAEAIRNKYNYSGGTDGSQYIPTQKPEGSGKAPASGGGGSSGGGYVPQDATGRDYGKNMMTDADYAALKAAGDAYNAATTDEERQAAHAQAEAIRKKYNYSGGADGSQYIPGYAQQPGQVPDFSGLLNSWLETAQKQQQAGIDYATDKGVADLERAEADAQKQFQTQQNQTDIEEAKALDNQALYAEARGDRGGIGQAQYGQIQATAMENRRAIRDAQVKLSTDTARQIADLRAQGEFQKADALLQLTQNYLSQLMDLQKWGAEYAMNAAQFNAQLEQWKAEFELSVGGMMGEYQGAPTLEAKRAEQALLVESGLAALAVGVKPSAAQQKAMGYTDAQVAAELAAYKLAQQQAAARKSGGGGGGGPYSPKDGTTDQIQDYNGLFEKAKTSRHAKSFIANNYKKYGFTSPTGLYEDYLAWDEGGGTEGTLSSGGKSFLNLLRQYPSMADPVRVRMIQDALGEDKISADDADIIARMFGYGD